MRNKWDYRQSWFVLCELTKRELKRKYSRSYLGIMWSSIYPLMRMILVVFLFSYVFNKGIEKYPAYYFVAMFYSVDQVLEGVKWFIIHNPMYAYIKVLREFIVYGQGIERIYLLQMVLWGGGMYVAGVLFFKKFENHVVERL